MPKIDAQQEQDVDVALGPGEEEPVHDEGKEDHHADADDEIEVGVSTSGCVEPKKKTIAVWTSM